jgi:hypothetical protein
MAGFEVTLYGRIWVTPEDRYNVLGVILRARAASSTFRFDRSARIASSCLGFSFATFPDIY